MVSKKTVAGGVALGGSSIGAGFGVSKLAEKLPINKELQARISLVKERFNFDLESYKCTNYLRVEENNEDNYRSAFFACSQAGTLSDLAKTAGLDVLSNSNKGNSGLAGGDNNKEEVLRVTGIQKGSGTQKEEEKIREVADGCEKKLFSTETKDNEWHDFLIACTKNGKFGMTRVSKEIRFKRITADNEKKYMNDHARGDDQKHFGVRIGIPGVTILGTAKVDERDEHLNKDLGNGEEKLSYKIKTFGFKLENENDKECNDALSKESNKENFKAAVKACFKNKKFSDRAKALGFRTVPESKTENNDGKELGDYTKEDRHGKMGEIMEEIKNKFKERIKVGVSEMTTTDSGSVDQPKIKKNCDSKDKQITGEFTNDDGQKYLKGCTKNKSITLIIPKEGEKAIDFGTGKYTETAS